MQRFIPLLPAFPPDAFFADLFELFPSGGVARVDFEHSIELQFRFGQGAFRHSLLGSAQSLRNVVGAFEGGLHLAKNFPRRLVSRIELQRGFRLRLGILVLPIRKQVVPQMKARVENAGKLLANGQVEDAKAEAEAALKLDSTYQPARSFPAFS